MHPQGTNPTTHLQRRASTTVVEAAYDYIRQSRNVSFVELARFLEGEGMCTKGDLTLMAAVPHDLILWANMSDEFVDVVDALAECTDIAPTPVLVYLCDGGALKLPLAKRPPKGGYKRPHWCPVVFNVKQCDAGADSKRGVAGTPVRPAHHQR